MPRKVFHGVDYDDDYDAYEDEDYDYDYRNEDDYELEGHGKTTDTNGKQEKITTGVWPCPICTYDNEDSMSACEICGVLRNPLVKVKSNSDTVAVPFKFDAPSPDDLVSNGLRSVKLNPIADFNKSLSLNNNSSKEIDIVVESDVPFKGSESSSESMSRVKQKKSALDNRNEPEAFDDMPISSTYAKTAIINNEKTASTLSKSGKAGFMNEGRAISIPEYKPEPWMIPSKENDGLNQLNLAIVGHVDSGKSTLSGRLLHLLGRISQKQMHKYEKEAKQQGKGSFAYAWALDESSEERERGITMTVAVAFFTSKKYHVVILDSPGHRDFVPNMISGATQADAAILVIDASIGSFEVGIDVIGGQTREHAQLIRSFGVDQIVILVNKMDAVAYSEDRFNVIKQKLGTCLKSCGFKDSSVLWVPASAMENQNLVSNPSDVRFSWFKGPYLLEAIDSLQLPARDYSKPLLMPIVDFVKSQSQGHVSVCGKLETGAIRAGCKVLIMPSRELGIIRSLERDSKPCNIARAGDNVTLNLQGIEGNRVTAGGVMCHPDYPIQVSNHLELKILVLDISTPILIGSQLEFHIHHAKEAARIVKIVSLLDPKTGKATKKSPRCLLAKQNAIVEVVMDESVCVEEYSNCRALGRVSLRASGRTIALGVVTRVIHKEAEE